MDLIRNSHHLAFRLLLFRLAERLRSSSSQDRKDGQNLYERIFVTGSGDHLSRYLLRTYFRHTQAYFAEPPQRPILRWQRRNRCPQALITPISVHNSNIFRISKRIRCAIFDTSYHCPVRAGFKTRPYSWISVRLAFFDSLPVFVDQAALAYIVSLRCTI
jgi:hypothetical protein